MSYLHYGAVILQCFMYFRNHVLLGLDSSHSPRSAQDEMHSVLKPDV